MNKNERTALWASSIIVGMTGLTAAAVPLYDLFCRVTGYGGTPQIAEIGSDQVSDHTVKVRFNADRAKDLPWRFQPVQRTIEVKLGESHLAFYEAANLSDQPVVGTAVFNVAPFKAGAYFNKIQCFCFDQQTLEPGEQVQMPVSFFVDPEMLADANTDDVEHITLSYTFYIDQEATDELRASRNLTSRPLSPDDQQEGVEKNHG